MKIEFSNEPLAGLKCPMLVAFGFESNPAASGTVEALPGATRALLEELQAAGELKGKPYELTLVHKPAGLAAQRLLVVGAGKKEKFDFGQLRHLSGAATRYARGHSMHEVAWLLGGPEVDADALQCIAEGAIVADYDPDTYRTERNGERRVEGLVLATTGLTVSAAARQGLERGRIVGESQNFTRQLVNEPSNSMTPTILAQRAQEMAAQYGLECQVVGEKEIREMKMGAFWAVAQGSEEPPRLIVVRYTPADAPATPVVGLVGKGITFDTGGISIKPAADMHEMKMDMAGGATMLGVMRAIAQLKPKVRVIAVIPATENMPSGKAFKPGDVVTAMSGKTIEILNTDAEGRLVLADALHYAKTLGCTALIDAATLTGAVVVALGSVNTGVFGWNSEWVNRVMKSAAATGEKMWHMPVDEEYRDLYKSAIADIANTGGRWGGAITAAMFVGDFVGETPWVHLDIAGTAWSTEEKPYRAKGPSGHGVPTLVHLLADLDSSRY